MDQARKNQREEREPVATATNKAMGMYAESI
jgi:hypothetical protein